MFVLCEVGGPSMCRTSTTVKIREDNCGARFGPKRPLDEGRRREHVLHSFEAGGQGHRVQGLLRCSRVCVKFSRREVQRSTRSKICEERYGDGR